MNLQDEIRELRAELAETRRMLLALAGKQTEQPKSARQEGINRYRKMRQASTIKKNIS